MNIPKWIASAAVVASIGCAKTAEIQPTAQSRNFPEVDPATLTKPQVSEPTIPDKTPPSETTSTHTNGTNETTQSATEISESDMALQALFRGPIDTIMVTIKAILDEDDLTVQESGAGILASSENICENPPNKANGFRITPETAHRLHVNLINDCLSNGKDINFEEKTEPLPSESMGPDVAIEEFRYFESLFQKLEEPFEIERKKKWEAEREKYLKEQQEKADNKTIQ